MAALRRASLEFGAAALEGGPSRSLSCEEPMNRAFLSSVISGYEDIRSVAAAALRSLDLEVVKAEDFGARAETPQVACLTEVRGSDLVVLLVGARYGATQPSGLSATHEEFREAAGKKPILVFVQTGVEREPEQTEFLREIQEWESGALTESFANTDELRDRIVQAGHRHLLRLATGRADPSEMTDRCRELLRSSDRQDAKLVVAVANGPKQQVISATRFDAREFEYELFDVAVGREVFEKLGGATRTRDGRGVLELRQDSFAVSVDQLGSVVVAFPAATRADRGILSAIVEEETQRRIEASLQLTADVLDRVDPTMATQEVCVLVALIDCSYLPWRTSAEFQRDGGSGEMGQGGNEIVVAPPRPAMTRGALRAQAPALAGELTALLRRQMRRG